MFPITIWKDNLVGANASNNAFRILMQRGLKYPEPVWAQEYYEARLKRNPFRALRIRFSKNYKRNMELISHEIETQCAFFLYQVDPIEYRTIEARTLRAGYNGLFKHMSVNEIVLAMYEHRGYAKYFCERHGNKINKYGKEPDQ